MYMYDVKLDNGLYKSGVRLDQLNQRMKELKDECKELLNADQVLVSIMVPIVENNKLSKEFKLIRISVGNTKKRPKEQLLVVESNEELIKQLVKINNEDLPLGNVVIFNDFYKDLCDLVYGRTV